MNGFLGFDKEDFTSIVDVGAAVFQLMSDLAFYDGSDDASGIHSIDRDVGHNKVVSERRKQAIQEYYETEEEDEARNPRMDSREEGFSEVEQFSSWATRDTFDESTNTYGTYGTSDAPLLPVKNHLSTRNVYFGTTKPTQESKESASVEVANQEKPPQKSALKLIPKPETDEGDESVAETIDDDDKESANTSKKDSRVTSERRETASLRSERTTNAPTKAGDFDVTASPTKQVNPKLVVGKPSGSSHHSRTVNVDGESSVMSMPITKNEGKIYKRLLMKRAKAQIAKYNAEQAQFRVILHDKPATIGKKEGPVCTAPKETTMEKPEDTEEESREPAPAAETPAAKADHEASTEPNKTFPTTTVAVSKREKKAPSPPIALPTRSNALKDKEETPEIVKSESRDHCRGIVSQRAALWQNNNTRQDPPGKPVMDYDEYVKHFRSKHKREKKLLRPVDGKRNNQ